jgi:hypothetical protein
MVRNKIKSAPIGISFPAACRTLPDGHTGGHHKPMGDLFQTVDRDTPYLLPPSVQDWLPESHLARFVVEVVSKLDLRKLEGTYAGRGSKAYHPATMLALLFYGYVRKNLFPRLTGGEQLQHVDNADAHASNTGPPTTFPDPEGADEKGCKGRQGRAQTSWRFRGWRSAKPRASAGLESGRLQRPVGRAFPRSVAHSPSPRFRLPFSVLRNRLQGPFSTSKSNLTAIRAERYRGPTWSDRNRMPNRNRMPTSVPSSRLHPTPPSFPCRLPSPVLYSHRKAKCLSGKHTHTLPTKEKCDALWGYCLNGIRRRHA